MDDKALWLIFGGGLVTFLPRWLPIVALKNARIPIWFQKWMSFLPVSIFAALIASDIFFWEGTVSLNVLENAKLLPSLVTALVAYYSKNMILSVIVGIAGISLMVWAL
ncbi:AzlD domain-containing protein [Trichococcus sp.]|uniref:AzlD domain-containing protein n=1 Tax=Trichococcus sp. TaxID=1985464 RepID=UPI003C7E99BD